MARGERWLPDDELVRPAAVLAKRFIQRWDVHALQLRDGRYICVQEPLNVDDLHVHLRGQITLGTYLLDQKSQARFVVLDNDMEGGWDYLLECQTRLVRDGLPAYLEKSRRGGHIWLFFEKAVDGGVARDFSQVLIDKHRLEGFEIYPKQASIGKGLGSLIRLPFGIHQLTGRRYGFYDESGQPLGRTLREQLNALQSPHFVPKAHLDPHKVTSPSPSLNAPSKRPEESTGPVSERIKEKITALEFISQYVDLKPSGTGAVGQCPFHDDQHPSFGVNDEGNYWHCFAGCGGGSIIDFWSLWRKKQGLDPGFVATITDLAGMLL